MALEAISKARYVAKLIMKLRAHGKFTMTNMCSLAPENYEIGEEPGRSHK